MGKLSKLEIQKLKFALKKRDLSILREVPKTDLHSHSYLSAGWKSYKKIYKQMQKPPKNFGSLHNFLDWLKEHVRRPRNMEEYKNILSASFERMCRDGIVYAELSYEPDDAIGMNSNITECAKTIKALQDRFKDRIKVNFDFGLNRSKDPKDLLKILDEAIKTEVFTAIDLYGDEFARPIKELKKVYEAAKEAGLKLKAHLGEIGSAEDVKIGVEMLGVEVVQHGIAAVKNKDVMAFLRDRGTILHVCPTSNISLGVCKSYKTHPIKTLFDNGVKVTINTDDFLTFNDEVSSQIIKLYRFGALKKDEIVQIIDNGLGQL